jgi:TfoX/Sxy family transcriptional regulator of competence genes
MAYDELLAQRVRESLQHLKNIKENEMMGGINFLYNGKMCIGIIGDELVCRIDPALYEQALSKKGCREMDFTGRPMKGWVMIAPDGMKRKVDFDYWIDLALEFNKKAKSYKKENKK